MNIKSEKKFYANELKQKALRFNADIFVWGEELIDKKVILYPKKLKDVEEYNLIREQLEPCGIVLIDTRKSDFLYCTSATINTENGYVYFPEGSFNSAWEVLKNEEKHKNSRKQSLLDNPKMLYFYSDNSGYYHDKNCEDVKYIIPERFQASDKIPDGKEICPKCKRKLFFRIACYPNTRQMPICDRIFKKHRVSNGRIQHYVMDVGMKFHTTDYSQMQVEGVEDNWIIKGLDTDSMELWHNNYVKTSFTERYITDGYHNQKVECDTLGQLLNYIETYSWKKHLQHERIMLEEAETEPENKVITEIDNDSYADNVENKTPVRKKWYGKLWNVIKWLLNENLK